MNKINKSTKVRLRLKEIMQERALTQVKLSEMSGISRISIGNLVNGASGITFASIEALCSALRIPVEQLITYVDTNSDTQTGA